MVHSSLSVPTFDTLGFVGLERSHLRTTVYRRVFGDDTGPVRIGRYSILERIGSGARGVVFKAFDNQLDRLVALKVLSTRAGHQAELLREAKALARLSHPNVLPVYEVGETEEGQVFLATEYVKGWTLRGWYDEEHRSEASIVDVMRQVALGVQTAHDEGLVHRDLKPANILLGEDGRVRVADFGLARFDPTALEPGRDIPLDGIATTTAGTPGYMAPELFDGNAASAASDQFALAVTLHELLEGELPKKGGTLGRSRLANVIRRGLSPAPEDRFPSVQAFADALDRRRARRPIRRLLLIGAGVVAIGGVGAGSLFLEREASPSLSEEVALLRAKAELPHDPAAALEALRSAPDLQSKALLPVAEHALALGPETTRLQLPGSAEGVRLVGNMVFYRESGELVGRRLDRDGASAVDPSTLGISDRFPSSWGGQVHLALDADGKLGAVDPWTFQKLAHEESNIAASRDGRVVARIEEDGSLTVRNVQTAEILWSHSDPAGGEPSTVKVDTEGARVAWSLTDGTVFVHDLATDITHPLGSSIGRFYFDEDEDTLVVQDRDAGVYRRRLSDGRALYVLPAENRYRDTTLSPDGRWLAARSEGRVFVAELDGIVPFEFDGDSFSFSPDSQFVAIHDGETARAMHLRSGDTQAISPVGNIMQVGFAGDGSLWTLGPTDLRRHVLETPSVLEGHEQGVNELVLSRDGQVAVSTGRDFKVWVWDVAKERGRVLTEVDWSTRGIVIDEAANRVAVAQSKGETHFFDLDSGAEVGTAPRCAGSPAIGPEGAVVCASKEGVWSNLDGTTTMLADDVECGPSTASSSLIAAICGDENPVLHVWKDGEHHQTPSTVTRFLDSVHVWPDSRHLLHYGKTSRSFALRDNGELFAVDSPVELLLEKVFLFDAASSEFGDLLAGGQSGIYAAWGTADQLVKINEASASALALSGDGRTYAYANDNTIVVRKRDVSALQPNLAEVLSAHARVEGKL